MIGALFRTGVGTGVVFVFGHHIEEAFQLAVIIAGIGACVIGADILHIEVGTVVYAELVVLAIVGFKVGVIHHGITWSGGIHISTGVAAQFLHLIHRIVDEKGATVDDAQHFLNLVKGIFLSARQGVHTALTEKVDVAVVDDHILEELHRQHVTGSRGIRLNDGFLAAVGGVLDGLSVIAEDEVAAHFAGVARGADT